MLVAPYTATMAEPSNQSISTGRREILASAAADTKRSSQRTLFSQYKELLQEINTRFLVQ
jgi:hypothetical protein